MRNTIPLKDLLKIIVTLFVVGMFIIPGTAVNLHNSLEKKRNDLALFDANRLEIEKYTQTLLSDGEKLSNGGVRFTVPGDDYRPHITKNPDGYYVISWTNEEDIVQSNMGIAYTTTSWDPASWTIYTIDLDDVEMIDYVDTAYIAGPQPGDYRGFFGTFIDSDLEQAGGYQIVDIEADPSDWFFYTWCDGAPECSYACVDDNSWYQDINYPEINGPFHMYMYRQIDNDHDIPDCPICFHTGVLPPPDYVDRGFGYFDAQSALLTAPARDPDMTNLDDRFHVVWMYHNETTDVDQIVWKKVVPSIEPDIEYTPYQRYLSNGSYPAIAAYNQHVAVVYTHGGSVKCEYSNDDGETWYTVMVAEGGTFPDIEAVAGIFCATYTVEGDLYLVTSDDGGATWSAPVQLNSIPGSVVEEENCVDIAYPYIACVDRRGSDLDICVYSLFPPPPPPELIGPTEVKVNTEATYCAVNMIDPQEDDLSYFFDWGDGTTTGWTEWYPSGEKACASHTWTDMNEYEVSARAMDRDGHKSDWLHLRVSVPKPREVFINSWFMDIIQTQFPFLSVIWRIFDLPELH